MKYDLFRLNIRLDLIRLNISCHGSSIPFLACTFSLARMFNLVRFGKLFLDHTTLRMILNPHYHKEVLVFTIHPEPGKVSWAKEQSSEEQW